MTKKDKQLVDHILRHYNELLSKLEEIKNNYDYFDSNLVYQKAIKIDLFQIGELFNSLLR